MPRCGDDIKTRADWRGDRVTKTAVGSAKGHFRPCACCRLWPGWPSYPLRSHCAPQYHDAFKVGMGQTSSVVGKGALASGRAAPVPRLLPARRLMVKAGQGRRRLDATLDSERLRRRWPMCGEHRPLSLLKLNRRQRHDKKETQPCVKLSSNWSKPVI